jgi:sugar lactone lactonase YvrE
VRFSAAGKLDLVVELPAQQVTMCTFGGAGYKTLFVTTARNHLDAPALAEQPLAGSVFAIDVGVSGLPPTRFNAHFGGRPT